MQIIKHILKISGGESALSDKKGKALLTLPTVKVGIAYRIELDLRTSETDPETGELLIYPFGEVSAASGFYLCVDGDWDHETTPKLFVTEGISITQSEGKTILNAPFPNTALQGLLTALGKNKSVMLFCEVCGYAASESAANAIFSFDFQFSLRNRLFIEGDVPPEVSANPEYLTAAQVAAMIAEATRSTTPGPPGTTGTPGDDGIDGKSAYEIAAAGGYTGTVAEWLEALKGASAYEIAVANGYSGTAAQWLASLKGEPGNGLDYDKSGTLEQKPLYDAESAGFKFAATVVDSAARKTTIYIYTKNSAAYGDWSEPLTFVFYGSTSDMTSVEPLSFEYRENLTSISFSLESFPAACINQIEVKTSDGWQILPYFSDFGVRKMLRIDNKVNVFFGANLPTFTEGRVYLSQMIGVSAPAAGGGTIGQSKMYYGTVSGLSKLSELTDLSGLTEADAGTLGKTSLGVVPAGSFAVVVVPSSGFAAYKDDGFGGKVAFSENNGASGTGANGAAVTIGGVSYKVYGEFKLNNAEVFVYVDNQ